MLDCDVSLVHYCIKSEGCTLFSSTDGDMRDLDVFELDIFTVVCCNSGFSTPNSFILRVLECDVSLVHYGIDTKGCSLFSLTDGDMTDTQMYFKLIYAPECVVTIEPLRRSLLSSVSHTPTCRGFIMASIQRGAVC